MSGQLGTIPYPLYNQQWQDDPGTVWQPGTYPLPPPDISPLYAPPGMPVVEQPVPVYGPNVLAPPQDAPASWQQPAPVYQPPISPGPAPVVQGSPGVAEHAPGQMPTVTIGPDGKPVTALQETTVTAKRDPPQQQQQAQQPQQPQAPTVQQLYPALFGPQPTPSQIPIAQYTPTPIAQVTPPVPAAAISSAVGRPMMFVPPMRTQMGSGYASDDEHEHTARRYRDMLS